jgi:putative GTP pyrophosphokinase
MQQAILDRWRQEYLDLQPVAVRFSDVLAAELQQLLRRKCVPLATPIEHRVKSWLSIEEKLARYAFTEASLSKLYDLVGLRLILLFKKDIEIACELIDSAFEVTYRSDRAEELSYQTFGYQSIHYVVRPPKSWLSVPTFAPFSVLQAEIQVRTLSQHMWAAASHELQYKQEESVPLTLRRSIHRVSALLEIVDLEFDRILQEKEAERRKIHQEPKDRPLNTDVLAVTLDDLLPSENKGVLEPYSLLLWELDKLGVMTSAELSRLINKHLPAALEDERMYAESLCRRDPSIKAPPKGIFTHLGLVRLILQKEFGVNFFDSKVWEDIENDGKEGVRKAQKEQLFYSDRRMACEARLPKPMKKPE